LGKSHILLISNDDISKQIEKTINSNTVYGIKIFLYSTIPDIESLKNFININKIQTIVLDKDETSRQKLYPLLFRNINFQTFEAFYESIFKKIPLETIDHN